MNHLSANELRDGTQKMGGKVNIDALTPQYYGAIFKSTFALYLFMCDSNSSQLQPKGEQGAKEKGGEILWHQ